MSLSKKRLCLKSTCIHITDATHTADASIYTHARMYTCGGRDEASGQTSVRVESLDPFGIEWRREADLPAPR